MAIANLSKDELLRDRLARNARLTIVEMGLTWSANAKKVTTLIECIRTSENGSYGSSTNK
jgi:hypothetical protein